MTSRRRPSLSAAALSFSSTSPLPPVRPTAPFFWVEASLLMRDPEVKALFLEDYPVLRSWPLAYYLMQSPETKAVGDAIGFGSAFLFAAVFGIRLAATRKLIPSGLLLGLSAGALVVFFSSYMQDKF
uniref:Protein FATTY ACID EXPORT 4, chloroplastic-like n=1 Tax=Elaeis guineensis var. tenera TaxID=51953 RepID=A0A8N4I824_ELAGV|nr:protein FATTY ACID EXPORT 4, chloroplastic-like [Elaeis guineensis]